MTTPDMLTTMQTALVTAYPDEAWLVRDYGRLIKIELLYGTHTLAQYMSPEYADTVVRYGEGLLKWRDELEAT